MKIEKDKIARLGESVEAIKPLSLITVPAVISVLLMLSALCLIAVDAYADRHGVALWPVSIPYDTAKQFLNVVANGSITALSLTYSMVLIVFTLAAGNIGPRLLKRFSADRTNQVTAGLFGGSFLFSLTTLYSTRSDFVPQLTIGIGGLLAILSVAQLIYFVHDVSRSVTIDEEIADIAKGLERDLGNMTDEEERDRTSPIPADFPFTILSARTGYLGSVDWQVLSQIARQNDVVVKLAEKQGAFIIEDQPLALLTDELPEHAIAGIREAIEFDESRSTRHNIEFSIHLLIEIALRALSPAVNDTYTAIACIDRLSSSLAGPVKSALREELARDEAGAVRVVVPGMSAADMISTAFSPLRRAAGGNVLMSKHIADALTRLSYVARPEILPKLKEHALLLYREVAATSSQKADVEFIRRRLGKLLPKKPA